MPANAGLFASLRRVGRVGRLDPENRGVGGSSPPLAIAGTGLPRPRMGLGPAPRPWS
jgi:hypothetical protein